MQELKNEIEYADFEKVDIRIGTVLNASIVDGSDKLLKLEVDFGELGKRQILSGIHKWYSPEDLIGIQTTFVLNMKPRMIMGMESQGMLFALDTEDKPVFLLSKDQIPNGSIAL